MQSVPQTIPTYILSQFLQALTILWYVQSKPHPYFQIPVSILCGYNLNTSEVNNWCQFNILMFFGWPIVATIAVLNFFKDTLEGLSVELDLYFEDGTDDDVNNWKDIHVNIDSNLDKNYINL